MRLCPHNNLLAIFPNICKEWAYQYNQLGPENYAPRSAYKAYWICIINNEHICSAKVSNKTSQYGSGCTICSESFGEMCTRLSLNFLNIKFTPQWTDKLLPRKRFDFHFVYNGIQWIIEYDGSQHFEENPFFHRKNCDFEYGQEIDKIKTFVACNSNYKLIRIDHTNRTEESVLSHIQRALELDQPIYYSDPEMYTWLSSGLINPELLKQEAPYMWQKYVGNKL